MEVIRIANITFSDVYEQLLTNEKEEVCETFNPTEITNRVHTYG